MAKKATNVSLKNMKELFETMPQIGQVQWIGIRPQKRGVLLEVEEVDISISDGLKGDHYLGKSKKRQVTLIQAEHLDTVGSILKKEIDPKLTRRNIVVSGINLLALKDKQFVIGENVVLEFTGLCHPCSRMETNLGSGGYNAMRGHGGITAKVIIDGKIKIGDQVKYWTENTEVRGEMVKTK